MYNCFKEKVSTISVLKTSIHIEFKSNILKFKYLC